MMRMQPQAFEFFKLKCCLWQVEALPQRTNTLYIGLPRFVKLTQQLDIGFILVCPPAARQSCNNTLFRLCRFCDNLHTHDCSECIAVKRHANGRWLQQLPLVLHRVHGMAAAAPVASASTVAGNTPSEPWLSSPSPASLRTLLLDTMLSDCPRARLPVSSGLRSDCCEGLLVHQPRAASRPPSQRQQFRTSARHTKSKLRRLLGIPASIALRAAHNSRSTSHTRPHVAPLDVAPFALCACPGRAAGAAAGDCFSSPGGAPRA